MLSIDLKNAVNKTGDNFTCLLMQLMCKADINNFQKLSKSYPVEANIVWLYKNDCSYIEGTTEVDFNELERRAEELYKDGEFLYDN